MHTIIGKRLLMLKPSQIKLPARPTRNINNEEMKNLTKSIACNGIIEPIAVRKSEDGEYVLIAGERRLKAAVLAGLRRVPCVLHKIDSDLSAIYSLTENLQRSPLNYLEQANYFERMTRIMRFTPSALANSIGVSEAHIQNKLHFTKLSPELRRRIDYANLKEEYAVLLLLLPEYQRHEVLSEIISENLSLQETEELINAKLHPAVLKAEEKVPEKTKTRPIRKSSIGDIRLFGNSLNKLAETLTNSGLTVNVRKTESTKYIEYKVRIQKDSVSESSVYTQLSIV